MILLNQKHIHAQGGKVTNLSRIGGVQDVMPGKN